MLKKLYIQNYAIIDELELTFDSGLNVITGETGAGKSILMGALNLILGQRADTAVLRDAEKKCIVEGCFSIERKNEITEFFNSHELDFEDEIVIRREISSNGKSRSFINDTPVTLFQIKQLCVFLIDLHQQFDTLEINTENFQRAVLDALADNMANLSKLKSTFESYTKIQKELNKLKSLQDTAIKEYDYNTFLLEELETLSLKENELEQVESELKILNNAENIKQQLISIYNELSESDSPIAQQVKSLQNKLASLDSLHDGMSLLTQRLLSASIELQDISDELQRIESGVHHDAEKIIQLNERLSDGYKLLKKHSVNTTDDLLKIQQELKQKLETFSGINADIEKLEKEMSDLYEASMQIAYIISKNRKSQIKGFATEVNSLLVKVGMPNAILKVEMQSEALSVNGIDAIQYLFDANKSNKFEQLGKVASGGELSRLMLSIKSLVAKKIDLPTLIFDEIDTGIGGEAAKQVGIIMKNLSLRHQLIVITHQAQIAAKANMHLYVHKSNIDGKVKTAVKVLNNEERVNEIAQMMSGAKPTEAALKNALEMMDE